MKTNLPPLRLITLAIALTATLAPLAANIRDVKGQSIDPANTIAPESYETDVDNMRQNWYLRNYTVLDNRCKAQRNTPASDQEYIDRLQRLPTVIEMPYNKVVGSFIRMYVERKPQLVQTMLGMSLYYMPIFEEALERHQLPHELKYLAVIESALNPNAVSRAGAAGLWQFMPDTGTGEGLEVNSLVDERRDPIKSSDAAARYLKKLHNIYNDWTLAIAAYNCGPGNVNKALKRAGGGKQDFWEIYRYLPAETRDYIPAFIAANYAMNYYADHGISPALAARPIITDTVHVTRRVHLEQISEVLGLPLEEIRILNPQYRADIIPGDIHPYALILPGLQTTCYIANEDSIVNHNAEKYARRDIVEPGASQTDKNQGPGHWEEQLTVKYHKVKRGETLGSIARKYGVTTASIQKTNNIGKTVKRGTTLKINTTQRTFVPDTAAPTQADIADTTDTTATTTRQPDTIQNTVITDNTPATTPDSTAQQQQVAHALTTSQTKTKNNTNKKTTQPKPRTTTHTVASGESLYKIAQKNNTTVDEIKKANNLKSDNIQPGQKLTIPAKNTTTQTKSKKKKRR